MGLGYPKSTNFGHPKWHEAFSNVTEIFPLRWGSGVDCGDQRSTWNIERLAGERHQALLYCIATQLWCTAAPSRRWCTALSGARRQRVM